jgi:hypothetical protein
MHDAASRAVYDFRLNQKDCLMLRGVPIISAGGHDGPRRNGGLKNRTGGRPPRALRKWKPPLGQSPAAVECAQHICPAACRREGKSLRQAESTPVLPETQGRARWMDDAAPGLARKQSPQVLSTDRNPRAAGSGRGRVGGSASPLARDR